MLMNGEATMVLYITGCHPTTYIETDATSVAVTEQVPLPVPLEEVCDYDEVSMQSFQEVAFPSNTSPKDLSRCTSHIDVANKVDRASYLLQRKLDWGT